MDPRRRRSAPLMCLLAMALVMALMAQESWAQCPTNDLSSCLPAATSGSQPTATCCTNLAAYTNTATPAACLCQIENVLKDEAGVNPLYAILIPQSCNLKYPAGTTCSGYVIPGGQ